MPLNLKPHSECKIFVVDDDEMVRLTLQNILEEHFLVEVFSSGFSILDFCSNNIPDLILLDVNLPDINGLEVCRKLRLRAYFEHIPIVFITATYDTNSQNACWEAGATDFIGKPIIASTLLHRSINHLENKLRLERLIDLTYKDALTELFNRHYLDLEVSNLFKQSIRDKQIFSLLMIDIDYFKAYNDMYGHPQGDKCLKELAIVLNKVIKRPQDIAIRYGGEEFLVVLPQTKIEGVELICQRIQAELNHKLIEHLESTFNQVTVSIGGAVYNNDGELSLEELIAIADQQLYKAKKMGRNQYRLNQLK